MLFRSNNPRNVKINQVKGTTTLCVVTGILGAGLGSSGYLTIQKQNNTPFYTNSIFKTRPNLTAAAKVISSLKNVMLVRKMLGLKT